MVFIVLKKLPEEFLIALVETLEIISWVKILPTTAE